MAGSTPSGSSSDVVETNTAAVALWQSLGFILISTVPETFDDPTHGLVGLHVMHRTQ